MEQEASPERGWIHVSGLKLKTDKGDEIIYIMLKKNKNTNCMMNSKIILKEGKR